MPSTASAALHLKPAALGGRRVIRCAPTGENADGDIEPAPLLDATVRADAERVDMEQIATITIAGPYADRPCP